jgi:hypothetical protein
MLHCQDGCSSICIVSGYISGTLEGGWLGDSLVLFWFCFESYLGDLLSFIITLIMLMPKGPC